MLDYVRLLPDRAQVPAGQVLNINKKINGANYRL